jgi:hypothetical protein
MNIVKILTIMGVGFLLVLGILFTLGLILGYIYG